ncbi:MAG TPA: cytochrome c biogenesis protein CcsA [Armatimonadota bacterium]|nr:cytochrome c biogenesis protein CcsA [Armatimonadota bacterium]
MAGFGTALLWGGLATALVAFGAYVAASRGQATRALARAAFALTFVTALAACLLLLAGFVQGRYEIRYIAEYSSRDLPILYRVSALWAGQEGSFLLWALLSAILGLLLIRYSGDWETRVMPPYAATQAYLGLLLVAKSPFLLSQERLSDGRGLNPLLQDPWMAIHPPMVFLGYAALAIPFVFALAALVWRDYDSWVSRALPWTLFAWVTLGAGICIGGYWAYRVLGWGGYWGWDPVENASLVPWLLATALLHGTLVQRARGGLKHANLLLTSVAFAAMVYGTFLTRSGVLSNFSVHSFVSPGSAVYSLLLMGVFFSLLVPLSLYATRAGEIQAKGTVESTLSREFTFFLAILVFCVSAAMVALGTSAPILTTILGRPTSVQPRFYNLTQFPVAVLLALLVGIAPLLEWGASRPETVVRRLLPGLAVALAGAVAALALGVHRFNAWMLLLVAAAAFALAVGGRIVLRGLPRRPVHIGGHLAHVGLALMLLGIVGSSVCSRTEKLSLRRGEAAEALGYRVAFTRADSSPHRKTIHLTVTRGDATITASPTMRFSPQMGSWVHAPAVHRSWQQDLYISPLDYRDREEAATKRADLGRGETMESGGYAFTFEGFDMSEAHAGAGILIGVRLPSGKRVRVTPTLRLGEGGDLVPTPAKLPGTEVAVAVTDLSVPMDRPRESRITLSVTGLPIESGSPPEESVVVEVSIKPLINLLWLGSVLLLAGGVVAGIRRAKEAQREAS